MHSVRTKTVERLAVSRLCQLYRWK